MARSVRIAGVVEALTLLAVCACTCVCVAAEGAGDRAISHHRQSESQYRPPRDHWDERVVPHHRRAGVEGLRDRAAVVANARAPPPPRAQRTEHPAVFTAFVQEDEVFSDLTGGRPDFDAGVGAGKASVFGKKRAFASPYQGGKKTRRSASVDTSEGTQPEATQPPVQQPDEQDQEDQLQEEQLQERPEQELRQRPENTNSDGKFIGQVLGATKGVMDSPIGDVLKMTPVGAAIDTGLQIGQATGVTAALGMPPEGGVGGPGGGGLEGPPSGPSEGNPQAPNVGPGTDSSSTEVEMASIVGQESQLANEQSKMEVTQAMETRELDAVQLKMAEMEASIAQEASTRKMQASTQDIKLNQGMMAEDQKISQGEKKMAKTMAQTNAAIKLNELNEIRAHRMAGGYGQPSPYGPPAQWAPPPQNPMAGLTAVRMGQSGATITPSQLIAMNEVQRIIADRKANAQRRYQAKQDKLGRQQRARARRQRLARQRAQEEAQLRKVQQQKQAQAAAAQAVAAHQQRLQEFQREAIEAQREDPNTVYMGGNPYPGMGGGRVAPQYAAMPVVGAAGGMGVRSNPYGLGSALGVRNGGVDDNGSDVSDDGGDSTTEGATNGEEGSTDGVTNGEEDEEDGGTSGGGTDLGDLVSEGDLRALKALGGLGE